MDTNKGLKMKAVVISDTHRYHRQLKKLPEGDLLIHCGDITDVGEEYQFDDFLDWFKSQKQFQYKLFIAGNHDFCFETNNRYYASVMKNIKYYQKKDKNLHYLFNNTIEIEGIKFYGSPYTKWFHNWAFNVKPEHLESCWSQIPDDTQVLITHGPCFEILDQNVAGEYCGDSFLYDRVMSIPSIKYHMFGHIHTHFTETQVIEKNGKTFINASVLNENYLMTNPPVVIDLNF
jgi:predicted phosphodiesterase